MTYSTRPVVEGDLNNLTIKQFVYSIMCSFGQENKKEGDGGGAQRDYLGQLEEDR